MRGHTVRTPERVDEAQRLRAKGLLYREIAEHFGIAIQTAHQWVSDPDGVLLRDRRQKYDLTCVSCGGRADGCSPSKLVNPEEPVCRGCAAGFYAIWTHEAIVFAIQEWADDHGGIPPTATDFNRAQYRSPGVYPHVNSVRQRFVTWNAAIRAAGFEPHGTGPVGGYTTLTAEQRAEAVRRYAAGESSVAIAADLDCSPVTVLRHVRKAEIPVRPGFPQRNVAA